MQSAWFSDSKTHPGEQLPNARPPNLESSIAVTFPPGFTLRQAIELLAEQRQSSVRFHSTCSVELLRRPVKPGAVSGGDVEQAIENLVHELVGGTPAVQLHVKHKQGSGLYEILCSR